MWFRIRFYSIDPYHTDSRLTLLTRGRKNKAFRLEQLTKDDEGLYYCHKPDDTVCNTDRYQLTIRQKRN